MKRLVSRFESLITGVLSGFDRLVFRGSLLPLMRPRGMHHLLDRTGIRLLDFGKYAEKTSERVKVVALNAARDARRPVTYLPSSRGSKEEIATTLLPEHPVDEGVVCALYVVEPCRAFEYHRSQAADDRGLRLVNRKGIDFVRHDNCFPAVGDVARANTLLADQLSAAWPTVLTEIARGLNPLHDEIFPAAPMDYYWSAYQTEWATDVMFREPASLAALYPALVRHAMQHFHSPDVMRFLGRKARLPGRDRDELQGPRRGRPREALGQRQLREDVRQGRKRAPRRDDPRQGR